MDIMSFILDNNLQFIALAWIIGTIIKNSGIEDKWIPFILLPINMIVIAAFDGFKTNPEAIATYFSQGVYTVGAAVLVNQLPKQLKK